MSQKVITDTFTRADNAGTLGTTEGTGATELQAWTYSNGLPWGISGNRAYRPAVLVWDSGLWGENWA